MKRGFCADPSSLKKRALFITLEGGEGSGKSTQIRKIEAWLKQKNIPVVSTREPGGTPGAEEIRELLVQGAPNRWGALTEALLLFAARKDHVENFVLPHLRQGTWVLCDRFTDSSWVYQGYASNLGVEKIEDLERIALDSFKPDFTFILDAPPQMGLRRAEARVTLEDRFEKKGEDFHQKLYEGYHELAQRNPQRCLLVSALGSKEDVFRRITNLFENTIFEEKSISDRIFKEA